jgi:adhesin/invasin
MPCWHFALMTPFRTRNFAVLAAVAAALAIAVTGCRNNGDLSTGPSQLIIVSGASQQAQVGTALPTAPAVRVQDAAGAAVSGVTVRFSVTGGGGTIIGDSAKSDLDGRAAVGQWIVGTRPGPNTLNAVVVGTTVAVNVVATAVPGTAVGVRSSSQQGFLALVGHAVAPAPAVLVVDSYGNPVPGATVTFAVASGGGSVTGATVTSDAAGVAQIGSWTLGSSIGANTLQARIPSGAALTFTAQALNSSPVIAASTVTLQAGYLQFPVANVPRVLVTDSAAHPLVGVPVTFTDRKSVV